MANQFGFGRMYGEYFLVTTHEVEIICSIHFVKTNSFDTLIIIAGKLCTHTWSTN